MPATINRMMLNKAHKRGERSFLLALPLLLTLVLPSVSAKDSVTTPPAIVMAEIYRPEMDPTRYLMSEKLDGVRAIWDGDKLKFRSGRLVAAPAWFVAGLPSEPLDGELWLKRGGFDELSGIVRKSEAVDAEWRRVRYMVFELPGAPGTFTERVARIEAIVQRQNHPWIQTIEQFRVPSRDELSAAFQRVVRHGGEGLMLHLADAPYVTGRSDVLLKLKPLQDAEATVIAHIPGRGRLQGNLGALEVQTSDGKRFRLGSGFRAADRRKPPPIGATVTYRYQELSKGGIPRFPRYWRVRQEF
jgi:DNA ligase-1